jgi:hypothetical protein
MNVKIRRTLKTLSLIIFIISMWIMDLTSWIKPNISMCNGLFCIHYSERFLIYHITWYIMIIIGLYYIIESIRND